MKKLLAVAAVAIFLLLFAAVLIRPAHSRGNYSQAPDFKVTDLTGKSISLSDYRGKVLFLNFWATWCPPCRAEIPEFVEVYGEQKAKGLEILGISLDSKGKEAVAAFVNKYKINYPVVLETRNMTEKLVNDYRPGQFIPTTIIIDKQGQIRNKHVGQMSKEMLVKYFQQLASE
mgnify:CR=1 FL=1